VTDGAFALRTIQGRLLLPPSARTIRWASFVVIGAVAALAVWSGGHKHGDPAVAAMPAATTLLCVWLCFLFEDLAAETTDTTATPLAIRRAVRAAIAVPATTFVWFGISWIAPLDGPTSAMTASFAAEVMFALAAAAIATRAIPGARGGLAAAAALVFVTMVAPVWLGDPPSVDPSQPPFGTTVSYWSTIAAAGAVTLVWAHLLPRRR
jgi:hypothetical protein